MRLRKLPLTILAVLILAASLRLYHIGAKQAWFDETISICHAQKPFSAYFFSGRLNYKPVYFFLLNMWVQVFGEQPYPLRVFSALFGVLGVLLIYKLGKELFNKRVGLISAFLLAISVFHIFQSQQIRHFSFLMFLILSAAYFLIRCSRQASPVWFCGLAATNILIVFTHPYGLAFLCVEAAFLLIARIDISEKKWVYTLGAISIFLLFWAVLPNKAGIKEMTWWIPSPRLSDLFEALATLSFGGPRYGLSDFKIWGGRALWMAELPGHKTVFLTSLLLLGLYLFLGCKAGACKPAGQEKKSLRFVLLWFFVPLAAAVFISWAKLIQVFAIKHLIIVLPAFIILVARGLALCGQRTRRTLLAVIVVLHALPLKVMYDNYFGTDWRAAAQVLTARAARGDLVVIYPLMEIVPFLYYYAATPRVLADMDIYGKETTQGYASTFMFEKSGVLISGIKQDKFGDTAVTFAQDFTQKASRHSFVLHKTAWVLVSRWTDARDSALIMDYFGKRFDLKQSWQLQGLKIYQFEHKQGSVSESRGA